MQNTTDYTKIFTGRQYLDLMKCVLLLHIKVIQFIKNEFYSGSRTNNITPNGNPFLHYLHRL